MKKSVPAYTKIICDICGEENDSRFEHSITHKTAGADVFGNGAGSTTTYDMCQSCNGQFTAIFDSLKDAQKNIASAG